MKSHTLLTPSIPTYQNQKTHLYISNFINTFVSTHHHHHHHQYFGHYFKFSEFFYMVVKWSLAFILFAPSHMLTTKGCGFK